MDFMHSCCAYLFIREGPVVGSGVERGCAAVLIMGPWHSAHLYQRPLPKQQLHDGHWVRAPACLQEQSADAMTRFWTQWVLRFKCKEGVPR